MNLNKFRQFVKTVSKTELDAIFDEVSNRVCRSPATKLGKAMALDIIVCENEMRRQPLSAVENQMIDDEILAELLK